MEVSLLGKIFRVRLIIHNTFKWTLLKGYFQIMKIAFVYKALILCSPLQYNHVG